MFFGGCSADGADSGDGGRPNTTAQGNTPDAQDEPVLTTPEPAEQAPTSPRLPRGQDWILRSVSADERTLDLTILVNDQQTAEAQSVSEEDTSVRVVVRRLRIESPPDGTAAQHPVLRSVNLQVELDAPLAGRLLQVELL